LHLLHTEGLAGDNPHKAAKECNECYYAEGKGDECTPKQNGTFQCCGETDYDGTQGYCPVAKDKTTSKNAYALRYVVNYTRDVDTIKPLKLGVLTTPNCATYYEQLRNDDDPESLSRTEFEVPKKMTVRCYSLFRLSESPHFCTRTKTNNTHITMIGTFGCRTCSYRCLKHFYFQE